MQTLFELALSVREITNLLRQRIEGHPPFQDVLVRGEVSGVKDHHPTGHLYFSLREEGAVLRCVMFQSWRRSNGVFDPPAEGEEVVAQGYIGVYEREGRYQLYVQKLWRSQELRLGEYYLELERVKARLAAEGLFDSSRKRPLPFLPRRIGIVTSPSGAALRDMVRIIWRRFPPAQIYLFPALVQGDRAVEDIVRAIGRAGRWGVEVLIVGRGGGAAEELWAFNSEEVARAIASCPVPVISAVGHETDFTIADFVADVRAPTPSAAAETVVPEREELLARLADLRGRLGRGVARSLDLRRERLRLLQERLALRHPRFLLASRQQALDELGERLGSAVTRLLKLWRQGVEALGLRLEALNPVSILSRGYSICLGPGDRPLRRAEEAERGDRVKVILWEGFLGCRVEEKGEGRWK